MPLEGTDLDKADHAGLIRVPWQTAYAGHNSDHMHRTVYFFVWFVFMIFLLFYSLSVNYACMIVSWAVRMCAPFIDLFMEKKCQNRIDFNI